MLREAREEIGATHFTAATVQHLTSDRLRILDQLAYRFGKLQDTLGLRVLPGILDLSEEPFLDATPFAQKLQRLERLGAIPSVDQWRLLRELRNQLAHEYIDAPSLKAAALTRFITGVEDMLTVWRHVSADAIREPQS
ncbi:hypothetical protein [Thiohalocapsa halophila]|uniref:hypothetical protein n=1 Tax=Thiohalocapsa halophila TaxID=69359 RepID=UPI001903ABD9|nr:hypothetical protein [Thiohalocapsa halophila]